ncbi:MAG TPA: hypothetical protein VMP67_08735 [Candidatus Limnocylindria bacterium]|nr:hypothetical protein [Candidatus Limnocylindria bacterium]
MGELSRSRWSCNAGPSRFCKADGRTLGATLRPITAAVEVLLLVPVLVINPRTDEGFAHLVHRLAQDAETAEELQDRLRESYPRAVARARGLAGESAVVWYVYRDGRWTSAAQAGGGRQAHDGQRR